jgi:hypothetical protein
MEAIIPGKKLIRHFEPRYGASQEMVDQEATHAAREHQDYMLLAANGLKQKLHDLRARWQSSAG